MLATEIANRKHGGDRMSDQEANVPLDPEPAVSLGEAAKLIGASRSSVRHAHQPVTVPRLIYVPRCVAAALRETGRRAGAPVESAVAVALDQFSRLPRATRLSLHQEFLAEHRGPVEPISAPSAGVRPGMEPAALWVFSRLSSQERLALATAA